MSDTEEFMYIKKSTLDAFADSMRSHTDSTDKMTLAEFQTYLNDYCFGIGDVDKIGITIPSILNTNKTKIVLPVLANNSTLTEVHGPNVTQIGSSFNASLGEFENDTKLTVVDTPNLTTLSYRCFFGDTALTTIDLSKWDGQNASYAFNNCTKLLGGLVINAETISGCSYMFNYCTSLTSISFPNATTLSSPFIFNDCSKMTTLIAPKLQTIGRYTLTNASGITELYLPELTTIEYRDALRNMTSLTRVCFPKLVTTGYDDFWDDTKLVYADMGTCTFFQSGWTFENCNDLMTVILRNTEQICQMAQNNCFSSTQHFKVGGTQDGKVYVPDALVDTYKADSMWKNYSACIYPLSELPEDEEWRPWEENE